MKSNVGYGGHQPSINMGPPPVEYGLPPDEELAEVVRNTLEIFDGVDLSEQQDQAMVDLENALRRWDTKDAGTSG